MGFRKMEDQRRLAADKEAAARRALDPQVRADAARLVAEWNERQAKRIPTLLTSNRRHIAAPALGIAVAAVCRLSMRERLKLSQWVNGR